MHWFRRSLRKYRILVFTFLWMETFFMVDGRNFVYAYQVHQEKEARLQEVAQLLDLPVEKLRPDHESLYESVHGFFGKPEDPVQAAGLARLQESLHSNEALAEKNPYRAKIEQVKRQDEMHRIGALVNEVRQLVDPKSGALPEASQRALLRNLHQGLGESVQLPPLAEGTPSKAQGKQRRMQEKIDRFFGSVRPLVASTETEKAARNTNSRVEGLQSHEALKTMKTGRGPRFVEKPLPLQRVEKKARRVDVSSNGAKKATVKKATGSVPTRRDVSKAGIAPEIVELAASLGNSPARIFRHVHDSIEFDPKWGAFREPLGTVWEGVGTAWDQAWLLKELLEAAGVDARFEWGEVEISTEMLTNITGLEDPFQAGDLLTTAGVPIVLLVSGSQVVSARMSHVWVKAFVDYIPSRGVTPGPGDTWLQMDPSLKRFVFAPGIAVHQNVPFTLGGYLQSGTELSPRRAYEDALWTYIRANGIECTTLEQLKKAGSIEAEAFPFLPGTLRAKILQVEGESMTVPAALQQTVEIQVRDAGGAVLATWSTPWPAVADERVEVAWVGATADDQALLDANGGVFTTPPFLVDLKPSIRVAGTEVASGAGIGSAEDVEIFVTQRPPGGVPEVVSHRILAGERNVLALDYGRLPQQVIDRHQAALAAALAAGDEEAVEAETLYLIGARYMNNLGRDLEDLAGWKWQRQVRLGTEGMISQGGKVTTLADGSPLTFTKAEKFVDIAKMLLGMFGADGEDSFLVSSFELMGAQSSFLEGQIFEQTVQSEGIAAVSALTRAQREGQTLTRVDSGNLSQTLAQVELGADIEQEVAFAVGQGKVAWVPEALVQVNQWQGAGYILEDPTTGAAGYLISGGLAGGADTIKQILGAALDAFGSEAWFQAAGLGPIFALLGIEGGGTQPGTNQSDPVNMATGNFWLTESDIGMVARMLPIFWMRTYNSRSSRLSPLGYGWSFNYGERLEEQPDGSVLYLEADGTEHLFTADGGGGFIAPDGKHLTLLRTASEFTLTTKLGLVSTFDLAGRLLAIAEPNGNTVTLQYDGGGQLQSVIDAAGRTALTVTTVGGKITQLTDLTGRTVTYGYTGDDLTSVTDPLNKVWTYAYDEDHNLIARSDPEGAVNSYSYNEFDRVVRHVDPLGHEERFAYPSLGGAAVLTDRRGFDTYLEFDERGRATLQVDAVGNAAHSTWDEDNNRSTVTDARGGTVTWTHDDRGNMLSRTNQLNETQTFTYDPVLNRLDSTTDASGHLVDLTWDSKGNLRERKEVRGTETLTVSMVYDDFGLLTERTDAAGNVTTQVWDEVKGSIDSRSDGVDTVTYVTDDLGRVTEMQEPGDQTMLVTWNARHFTEELGMPDGLVKATYDGVGRQTRLETPRGIIQTTYDAMGRITSTTDPLGSTTRFEYDPAGNMTGRIDPRGARTTTHYDPIGRPVATIDPLGAVWTFGYCADLQLMNTVCEVTDPLGNTLKREHDPLGRTTRLTDPLNRVAEFAYDEMGRRTEVRDPLGQLTRFEYNPQGQVSAIIDPNLGRTELSYNGVGRLTNIRDAENRDWPRTYDDRGRPKTESDPLGNTLTVFYDSLDNVTGVETPNGDLLTYEYEDKRQSAIVLPNGQREEFGYNTRGRRETVDSAEVSLSYEYDGLNRPTRVVDNRLGKEINYTFDESGNLTRLVSPEGTIDYVYDLKSQLVEMHDSQTGTYVFSYDPLGRRTRLAFPNGGETVYEYDAASQLTSLITRNATGDVIDGTTYKYDVLGRRMEKRTLVGDGLTETYTYDPVGRLKRWEKGPDIFEEYTYDLVGNREVLESERGTVTSTYDDADRLTSEIHQLSDGSTSTVTYAWDDNGNLLEKSVDGVVTTYVWDTRNRLEEVQGPGGTRSFGYDPYRQRVRETDATGTRRIHHAGEDILATYDATSGDLLESFTHGPGFDEPLASRSGSSTEFLHRDALGSITARSDLAGTVAGRQAYRPFGEVDTSTGATGRYGYASRELDDTGLQYLRARYYDPSAGRFISPDPLRGENGAPVDGTNLYTYVGNNPVMFTDPSGLNKVEATVNDITFSLTLIAAAGAFASGGLTLLLSIFGAGIIYSNIHLLDADRVERDEMIAFTAWVGLSIGLLPISIGFSVLLPVTIANPPDPFDELDPSWFSGASVYFSLAASFIIGVSFTLVSWDVFDPHHPTAFPRSGGDFITFGFDFGMALTFPPFAWSYAG